MKRLANFTVFAFLLAVLGVSEGFAYVRATIAKYEHAAPCGRLAGFAGLLQSANFIPSGDCEVEVRKGGCKSSRACEVSNPPSGSKGKGKCTPTPNGQSCACVLDK